MAEQNIREMVDRDIAYGQTVWEESSYDKEKMEALFHLLLVQYMEKIEGFSKNLRVVQPYEKTADLSEAYRENVKILLERLKDFRENGYRNEGLTEYYIAKERQELNRYGDFTSVRMEIGMMEGLPEAERRDILQHLDEMEEICARVIPQKEKWEQMRGYLMWLSGKEARVAMAILPLFFRIN